jgi:L-malate glycosyltransferase
MAKTVLLCRVDGNFGGVERTILSIAQNLDPMRYTPIIAGITNQGEMLCKAEKSGIKTNFIPMPSRFHIGSAARELERIALEHGVDILHTFGIRSSTLTCKVRKSVSLPWIIRLPNVNATDYNNPIRGFFSQQFNNYLIRRADALQVISPQLKNYVERWRRPPRRIYLIPNGIDTRHYSVPYSSSVRERFQIPEEAPIIGSTGRLERIKGYDVLLTAFSSILRSHPTARLLLVGEGPERGSLLRQAHDLGIEKSLILPGFSSDIREYLAVFDVYVCSSRSEGVSNSVLEAMSMQRPVIATQVGGMESIMENRKEGLLIAPEDPAALTSALVALLGNATQATQFAKAARARVEREFSTAVMIERVQAMYDEAVSQRER